MGNQNFINKLDESKGNIISNNKDFFKILSKLPEYSKKQILLLIEKTNFLKLFINFFNNFQDVNKKSIGSIEKISLETLRSINNITDSKLSDELKTKITDDIFKYSREQKEAIEQITKDNKNTVNTIVLSVLPIILILASTLVFSKGENSNNKI